jgi:tol-pal system protein YbgF
VPVVSNLILGRALRAVGVAAVCGVLWPAQAALFSDDEARQAILDLRARVESNRLEAQNAQTELRKAQEEQLGGARRSLIELVGQIDALRSELSQLRGQNEQLMREVSELQRQQRSVASAMDERLRTLEPIKVSLDGTDFVVQPREKAEYEAAMAALRGADFDKAADLYGQFLRRYPDSGYVPTALYWQGNARYASRDYKPAIDSYRTLIARVPGHVRVPEAMLAVANCQSELKDDRAARRTLEELVKAHPKSEAASTARERLARMK